LHFLFPSAEILLKGAINTINHLPEQSSSFLLHNVFALLSGSGGSFRGDSFSHRYPHSFSGGRSWSTRREPPIMGKQLENFITCGCESNAPFL
jgi:hypothetical protein